MLKPYIKDLYYDSKKLKKHKTIKTSCFKKKIKIFKKKNTMLINPNLKYVFRHCSVKEWYIFSKKLEKILKNDDYKLVSGRIISTLILSFIKPTYNYLLSSYYHFSSRRIPKIKIKFSDIKFLVKSLILNNDTDIDHLKLLKYKLNHIGISSYKFVFHNNITKIESHETLDKENLSDNEKDILKHYLTVNKRKRDFKIFKIRQDFIYDAFFLFFMDLSKYELKNVLFYKKNLNYFDYDFEVFVIKPKSTNSSKN